MRDRLVLLHEVPSARLIEIAADCEPFVRPRQESDYWLYGRLFSTTCKALIAEGVAEGFIVAFRSQDDPDELYIQDVAITARARRRGCATMLLEDVVQTAKSWSVSRVWLTSEVENRPARQLWARLGFVNLPTGRQVDGAWVTEGLKGPGRDRVIYQRLLP
jgi:GNAT superfamily N-acetyltransferase